MAEVTVNGKRTHFTTGGKAWEPGLPGVVLLHGAAGTQSTWVMQSRSIAHHGWNVAAPDLPGHGRSEDQPGLDSVEAHAAWTVDFLDALGWEDAVVVGHSMGAIIGLTLAATQRARVRGLVLVGARAEMEVSDRLLRASGEDTNLAAAMVTSFGHDQQFQIGGAPNPGTWTHGAARALMEACPAEVFHRDFDACNRWSGDAYAPKVTCPALVVSGQGDRMTPAAFGRSLAAEIPGAAYQEISGSGHMLMSEAPKELLRVLRDFLKDFNN